MQTIPAIDLDSNSFDSVEYSKMLDFNVINKYIYKRTSFYVGDSDESESWMTFIPAEQSTNVIYTAHDVSNAAYRGIAKTLERDKSQIMSRDSNTYHLMWNSTDINDRGETFIEFILSSDLAICT